MKLTRNDKNTHINSILPYSDSVVCAVLDVNFENMNDWLTRKRNKVPPFSSHEKMFWLCAEDICEDKRDFRLILKEARTQLL